MLGKKDRDPVKPDWYPDPVKRHQYRYWDGRIWTDHVADNGVVSLESPLARGGSVTSEAILSGSATSPAKPVYSIPASSGCKAFKSGRCVINGVDTGECDWNPANWQSCGVVIENRKYGNW